MGMRTDPETVAKLLAGADRINGCPVAAPAAPVAGRMSEAVFQAAICDLAERNGWSWWHANIAKRSKPGWVDLVLARERLLFIEAKDEAGQLTADQLRWRDIILAAGGDWRLWRPSSWSEVVETLTGRTQA